MQTARTDSIEFRNALYRSNLSAFTQKVFGTVSPGDTYLHNWHIDCIAEHLTACTNGEITRLIINIPPRYMKSISCTVAWPAWLLGLNPSARIMAGSYAQSLSKKHSVDCRQVIEQTWYRQVFPETVISDEQNTKEKWETTAKGHRMAVSVGGTAIGEGGDYLICDDPHNPKKAESDLERQSALDWFDRSFYTRLNDKKRGVIVVIMQRLHEKDLTGHLLEKDEYVHLKIPATAEQNQIITFGDFRIARKKDEPLHEEREDHTILKKTKKALGSWGYEGQYQQNPTPLEGGIMKLKWFGRYGVLPSKTIVRRVIQSWDTAYKPKEINDPSVCMTFLETDDRYYLAEVFREWLIYTELKAAAINQYTKWKPDVVLVEDKASGQSLIEDLKAERDPHTNLNLCIPVIAIEPEGDKLTRAQVSSPVVEAGHVWLPKVGSAEWLADLESEIRNFPLSQYMDQMDALSQFLAYIKPGRPEFDSEAGAEREFKKGAGQSKVNEDVGWGIVTSGGGF